MTVEQHDEIRANLETIRKKAESIKQELEDLGDFIDFYLRKTLKEN